MSSLLRTFLVLDLDSNPPSPLAVLRAASAEAALALVRRELRLRWPQETVEGGWDLEAQIVEPGTVRWLS